MKETTLSLLLLIPLIGATVVLFLPFNTAKQINFGKQMALLTSIVAFLESIRLWLIFDPSTSAFQFTTRVALRSVAQSPISPSGEIGQMGGASQLPSDLGAHLGTEGWSEATGGLIDRVCAFGIDGISIYFVLLTTLLIPVCLLASWDSIKNMVKTYLLCFLLLEELLLGVFTVLDLLGFYVLFEGVLIPMFLIIGIWGAREQKITAAYYFFFYTLVGSVLMLLSIFYIYNESGTTDYLTLLAWLAESPFDTEIQKIIFLAFFASLAVKIPKVPFHIWLPLAHVEAPLAGSVILAGVLIKLGSYGFIRFTLPLLPDASVYFTPLIFTLATLAVVYASLTTLRQTDLKRIIAYSSVSHMGVVMLGLWTMTVIGIEGSIFLQIAHGLVSSALFIVVTVLYDRHHTRIVKYYRGVAVTMPIFAAIFFFFTLANIAVPLSCNFIGEFLCLLATYEASVTIAILSSLGMVLSACYALFLFNRVCFGSTSPYLAHVRAGSKDLDNPTTTSSTEGAAHLAISDHFTRRVDITRREFYVLAPLAILTLVLGLWPNVVLDMVHTSVVNTLGAIYS